MISDNRFTGDSHAVHAERLLLMQQNFAAHSSEFALMNPEPLSWAPTCYTSFQAKRVAVSHQAAQLKAAVTAARFAFKKMRDEYLALRTYARQLFADDLETLDSLKLTKPYPAMQSLQLELVGSILLERANRVAAQETISIPSVFFDRLATAYDAAHSSFHAKMSAHTGANHARHAINAQRKADIQNLKLFLSFATPLWEENSVNYNDLGFARPEQMLSSSKTALPSAPTGLRFTGPATLEWTAVPNATSYYVSTSDDGEDWLDESSTSIPSITVSAERTGKVFYRVRARNAGGLGDYSAPFEHLFGVEPVQGFTYNRGELSWEDSEFAIMYEVERAPQGTGAYIRIFTGSDTIARDTPPQGTWTYRVRATNGTVKSEWVEVMIMQG
ncbi:MAG: fibronectin type III domain-containing protein [Candidatus Kapaibacterium sp.]